MTVGQDIRFPADAVYDFVERVLLAVGVEASSAQTTARGIWFASLRGIDSHGLRLLPHYVKTVQGGRVNPRPAFRFEQTSPSTGKLDADHGFGHAAGMCAMHHAIALARQAGSGHVAVRHSSHCGIMAYYALEACKAEMIGMAYTHATPKMRTPNATTQFFGTNPICLAAPMASESPFCYDGATTLMSSNKIRVYAERGWELPPACAADAQGNETRDPAHAVQMLPMGDYKGFGLAMMVEIFCSLLSGMPAGDEVSDMFNDPFSQPRRMGQFFSALRIDLFEEPARFTARLQEMADRIRRQPRRDPNVPVLVPGDPEKAFQADREANGIPIGEKDLARLNSLAEELRVTPLGAAESSPSNMV